MPRHALFCLLFLFISLFPPSLVGHLDEERQLCREWHALQTAYYRQLLGEHQGPGWWAGPGGRRGRAQHQGLHQGPGGRSAEVSRRLLTYFPLDCSLSQSQTDYISVCKISVPPSLMAVWYDPLSHFSCVQQAGLCV